MTDRASGAATARRLVWIAVAAAAFALLPRILLLLTPVTVPDGDSAVSGLMAYDLANGDKAWLMWPGQKYAAAVDTWFQAPTLLALGPGQLGLGLPLALFGAATVGVLAWTAGRCLGSPAAAVAVGGVLAVYPFWLVAWGTGWPGGYALSLLLGVTALAVALTTRRPSTVPALAVGALAGAAVWNQPLTLSLAGVAGVVLLLRTASARTAVVRALQMGVGSGPALALWFLGLQDGTDRTQSSLTATLTLGEVLSFSRLVASSRALLGVVGRTSTGLAADDGTPFVPLPLARTLLVLGSAAVLLTCAIAAGRVVRAVRVRQEPSAGALLVLSLCLLLVGAGAAFVLYPPAASSVAAASNIGVPRPLGIPRYMFPGLAALGALLGLTCWRAWQLPRCRGVAVVLVLAAVASSGSSVHLLSRQGSAFEARPSSAELREFAEVLLQAGATCVVSDYWTVYPVAFASAGRLDVESSPPNRLQGSCGEGPRVARLHPREGGVPSAADQAAVAGGARLVRGPGMVAVLG